MKKLEKSQESSNYYCDICHVKGYHLSLKQHLAGKKHLEMKSKCCKATSLINGAHQNSNGLQEKSKQQKKMSRFYCKVCNFQGQTKFEFEMHFSGMKHLKSM